MKKSTTIICIIITLNLCNKCLAQYTKLFDFNNANGINPLGSLISDGTFIYGTTEEGGTDGSGVLFKIRPDGTGFTKLLDFVSSTNGRWPNGPLISDGTFFYGTTEVGGIGTCPDGCGVIYKIKPDGTGYSKLFDFAETASGSVPRSSIISDGTFFYGMTEYGGTDNVGTVFKIKSDGTTYSNLRSFSGVTNGIYPWGSLISDGTFLYGMTTLGGSDSLGTIFKIKPDGTSYVKLLDFTGVANGSNPWGNLIFDGTFLYGMTMGGGTDSLGTIFKIKPDGTGYFKLLDFTGAANGSKPMGSLISDGTFLYGTTTFGGTNDFGTIFKLGTATGIAENNPLISFNVYPNPSKGTFTVETKENDYILNISSLPGQTIYQSEIKTQKTEIELNNCPAGIYFLSIETEKGKAVQKLIIN